ncbi:MAG: proton-coupled thiamine transporter YuaJ [Ruminococcaceae bacterium]|nr:proton-coupled thiamine transporter YuaJ [Oscillospiraceae bacterium]
MKYKKLITMCEGAVCVALSLVLSYMKIPIGAGFGGWGGSIDLVMIPLIVYALRRGTGWGLGAGLVFGTLKFFLAGGVAVNWQSMLLDYSVAYMCVGFAGVMRGSRFALPLGALLGCAGRFAIHFISGVTIYAIVVPTEIMGIVAGGPALYSLLYNGTYMLPNTVLAVAVCALLRIPLARIEKARTAA